jgi:hypothetical protein
MTENGRITSQQVLNASLSVVMTRIGLLFFGMRTQVERAEATGTVNSIEISRSQAQFAEVLRRLDRIEAKLDQTPRGSR